MYSGAVDLLANSFRIAAENCRLDDFLKVKIDFLSYMYL